MISLYTLWRDRDAADELAGALQQLAEVYAWFTEGFDTLDLRKAQALLAALDGWRDPTVSARRRCECAREAAERAVEPGRAE